MNKEIMLKALRCCIFDIGCDNCPLKNEGGCVKRLVSATATALQGAQPEIVNAINYCCTLADGCSNCLYLSDKNCMEKLYNSVKKNFAGRE